MPNRKLVGEVEIAPGVGRNSAAEPSLQIGPQGAYRPKPRIAPDPVNRLAALGELSGDDLASALVSPARPADIEDTKPWIAGKDCLRSLEPPVCRLGMGQPELTQCLVAYEPIWAIGDGARAADPSRMFMEVCRPISRG